MIISYFLIILISDCYIIHVCNDIELLFIFKLHTFKSNTTLISFKTTVCHCKKSERKYLINICGDIFKIQKSPRMKLFYIFYTRVIVVGICFSNNFYSSFSNICRKCVFFLLRHQGKMYFFSGRHDRECRRNQENITS